MKKRIYLMSSGTLERENNTIAFLSKDGKRFIPVREISSIFCFGEVNLNKRFLEFLTESYLPIHFFNYYGYYVGSYMPRKYYNSGLMTLKQSEHYLDNLKRLQLAKQFVRGSINNMRVVLNYYGSRGIDLSYEISLLETFLRKYNDANDVSELMGVEGNAKEVYYLSFNKIIKDNDFHYYGRIRRPPTTKLNTLISFGNGLLYTNLLGEIYKTHLDPRIGFLHSTNSRKFSLNLDVAELFKPLLVDRVIFSLINKSMLDNNDFSKELGGLYLSEVGRRKFLQEFESRLSTTFTHRILRRKISYQGLMRMELYKLEKHLLGEVSYDPFIMRW